MIWSWLGYAKRPENFLQLFTTPHSATALEVKFVLVDLHWRISAHLFAISIALQKLMIIL